MLTWLKTDNMEIIKWTEHQNDNYSNLVRRECQLFAEF